MNTNLFWHIAPVRKALILTVLYGTLTTVVIIVQMALLSHIVSQVFLFHGTLPSVMPLLLFLLTAILIKTVLIWLREITAQKGAIEAKTLLRQRLFTHLLRLGPAYSRGEATGELVTTLSEGIERLDAYVSRYLPQVYLSVLAPLLILLYIFPVDWASAVLLLVTGPIIPLLMVLVGSYAEKHIQRQWLTLSRMGAAFLDSVQGLPTLKLFNRSNNVEKQIARLSDGFRERTMKMLRVAFLSGMVLEFMTAVAIGLVAVTLGIRLLNNGISFEQAFLVLLLSPEFYKPLRDLGTHRHAGMEGKAALTRIQEILKAPVSVSTEGITEKRPVQPLIIRFSNVSYTYPGKTEPALQEVSLTLSPGTCTALIGRSGAGKSTLVHLLLRFAEVESGEITVNDIPIAELPVETWREYIALVPQKPYLFYDSVLANIRLARPEACEAEVQQAAELAGAADFISQLPQGYYTLIGERGTRLSAGQAQRITIARAFLKDAPLLILDEPASNLDPESETVIRQALELLMQNRTVLIIAHRYNTIASSQQIAVLEHGQLVESGSAAELLQHNATYAQMIQGAGKVQLT